MPMRKIQLRWKPLLYAASTLLLTGKSCDAQQQQDPSTLHGGSMLAMAGRDAVALAMDKRLGSGPALVAVSSRPVLISSPHVMVACTGLAGDVASLHHELSALVAHKYQRGLGFMTTTGSESSGMSPKSMASLTSHVLYSRKKAPYYVEPLVVGLQATTMEADDSDAFTDAGSCNQSRRTVRYKPYLCSLDMIGAKSTSPAFVCGGAAAQSLYGTAEAFWQDDLDADELVKVCGQAFLSALERDCLSGYGAVIYLIKSTGIIVEYDLAGRND